MYKKLLSITLLAAAITVTVPSMALAHVSVKPAQVKTAERQLFNAAVPNESDTLQIVGVRVVIPEGLKSATPNVKPGWTIEIKKTGEGESAKVTELVWTGGSIGVGQRDDFFFQSQAPAEETELNWKAYETYSDGTVVAWDQTPSEAKGTKPYSVTKVVKDLGATSATNNDTVTTTSDDAESRANIALLVGGLAFVLGSVGFVLNRKQ